MNRMKSLPYLFLLFALLWSAGLQAQYGTLSVLPADDARCEGGSSSTTNYGAETSIRSKYTTTGSSNFNRKSYIKFKLNGVNPVNIGAVKLNLYPVLIQGSNFSIDLTETTSAWSEQTINRDNAPAFGNVIKTFPCGTVNSWSDIDLSTYVTGKLPESPDISFGLIISELSSANQILWNSKEATSNQPALRIVFKAHTPSRFTAEVMENQRTVLQWDTTGCNATQYSIDRKLSGGSYATIGLVESGADPLFVDSTSNPEFSYFYRIVAVNPGMNASPAEILVKGTAPMFYVSSACDQYTTAPVMPSTINNPVLRLNITTQNDIDPLQLTSLDVSMQGTTSPTDVTGVTIYYTGSDSTFTKPVAFGTRRQAPFTSVKTMTGTQQLLTGTNYFWICYDIASNARFDNKVDAECLSVTLNGNETHIPLITTPPGDRMIEFISSVKLVREETVSSSTPYAGTNVVSFAQNVIATYKGYQYAAYWHQSKSVAVARKKIAGGSWEELVLSDYVSTNDLTDNHYNISLGLCYSDGTLHLSYDHHAHNLNYRRSVVGILDNPEEYNWSLSDFSPNREYLNGTSTVTQVTYPRFVTKPNGDMLLEIRKGTSGNGDGFLYEYSGTTHSWTMIGKYINGIADGQNAYLHGIQYDKTGKLHVSWCWRETSAPETNHDLYYAYSEDDGRTWKNTMGVQVGVSQANPLRVGTSGLKVWTIPKHRSLMNQESMCVDNKGRVHVLNGIILDTEPDVAVWGTAYPVHFYRDENGVWHRNFMMLESKKNRDQIVCDANNNIYIVLDNNIYMATEHSGWKNWKVVATKGTSRSGDGAVDKERALNENVLSVASGGSSNRLVQVNLLIDNVKAGEGKGLSTTFFNSPDFQNKVFSSTGIIDYNQDEASPSEGIPAHHFSVRFNGMLETRFAEAYTLYLTASEKAVCRIDGKLVVDGWQNEDTKQYSINLPLKASHRYEIEIASAFTTKPASVKLEWASARHPRSIVPASALYTTDKESTLTSTKELSAGEFDLKVFPNPVKDYFTVKIPDRMQGGSVLVSLVTLTGQEVFSESLTAAAIENKRFDLSGFPTGVYFLNVTINGERRCSKIINY